MKVAHVETGRHLYGGPQQVFYLVDELARRGVENVVIAPADSGIDAACRAAGVRVENVACKGDHDIRLAMRLAKILDREKPDLVHCHSRRGADLFGGMAARIVGLPAVLSRRVDNPESAWSAAIRYRSYDRIVAISDAIATVLQSAGVSRERIVVIRSAVDAQRFAQTPDCGRVATDYGLSDDAFVVACVAQFIHRKGQRFLLEAVARLRHEFRQMRVLLFGRGPMRQSLRDLAARLGIDDIVEFVGFKDDLDDYLGCFDLLVHPALREGLGVATLKAAAAGLPVIAFASGGLTESVVDGETGMLVAPGDSDALTIAIARLAADAGLRRRYGDAGRRRMQSEFSIQTMTAKHLSLYQQILARRRDAPASGRT